MRAALLTAGYEFPARRITVNLAPVELSKRGGRYDLPIALGLLLACAQLPGPPASGLECYGELGLDGALRAVPGLFVAALQAAQAGHGLLVPRACAAQVALSGHRQAWAASDLRAATRLLCSPREGPAKDSAELCRIAPVAADAPEGPGAAPSIAAVGAVLDEVVGQTQAKRALTIAAAGAHNLLLIGPPGSGKTMLAQRLPLLLPALAEREALELAAIRSLAAQPLDPTRWRERPFRAPHHTSSVQALLGGGASVRPGEICLAHNGVLFLDELPEFDRRVLEALREPLEDGCITLSRAARTLQLPARFQLVAAMNPCPCGYLGDSREACRCTPARIERYRGRLSGPLLDRIDLQVTVGRLSSGELTQAGTVAMMPPPCGQQLAELARAARARRVARSGAPCAQLSSPALRRCSELSGASAQLLTRSCQRWPLSGRGVQRLLAVARTIADLGESEQIEPAHLAEAIQLRRPLASAHCPTSESM